MGFERNRTFLMVFDDPDLEGLEVYAKGASAGHLVEMLSYIGKLDRKLPTSEELAVAERLIRMFSGCPVSCTDVHQEQGGNHFTSKIKSWNLERDGQPVPCTYEGLMEEDLEFVRALAWGWMDGQVGTGGDLGKDSNSGGRSVEELIPMETLSGVPLN